MDTSLQGTVSVPYGHESVWVFSGANATRPAAVFSSFEIAERWIAATMVTGTLTKYPVDQPIYNWAIANNYFTPKFPSQTTPQFISKFSSAYQEHFHYEEGIRMT